MHSKQALQQLLAAFAVLSVADASWLDKRKMEDKAVINRQLSDTIGVLVATSPTSSLPAAIPGSQNTPSIKPTDSVPSTTIPPQVVVPPATSTNKPVVTVQPSSTPPSSIPLTASPPPAVVIVDGTSSFVTQSTSYPFQWTPTTGSNPNPTTISATPVVSTKIEVITSTLSDGSRALVTTITKTTSTPALSAADGETTGMTTKTRNTVIGVVVGVGGSIVLGALALVAWRIWGRKKHGDEHDVLMDYAMISPGIAEKSERVSSGGGTQLNPFQSTLENYHQPSHVNPSSNF
ncbi:hypothetical protein E4U41_004148 [Claviceps citrina]|nr:hypothetical protein E4U41_004148 [Claviceps citrina]